jgi:hypothetical protein
MRGEEKGGSLFYDNLFGAGIFFFAFFTQVGTVLNNAYSNGSTLFDSAIEQSILWRSGWMLTPARAIDSRSYFEMHFSPILYIPSLLSYVSPTSAMTYYGIVYGVVYGALLAFSYNLFRQISWARWAAFVAAVVIYLSGPVVEANWEPHHEIMSSILMMGFFAAWFRGRGVLSLVLLIANAAVREDCGILLVLPLTALWLIDRLGGPAAPFPDHEIKPSAGVCAALSLGCAIAAFIAKAQLPMSLDTINTFYYVKSAPLAHLSMDLILHRLGFLAGPGLYVILGGGTLAAASLWLRDWRPMVGWFAFLPYFLFNFFSKLDVAANLGSYKSFPYVLTLVWPALLLLGPMRGEGRLKWVQVAVLFSGCVAIHDGSLGLVRSVSELADRWSLRPEVSHQTDYIELTPRLAAVIPNIPGLKGSQGAMALYPDLFESWRRASVTESSDAAETAADTMLWFEGDRDAEAVRQWLGKRREMRHYRVIGTRLVWSTNRSEGEFSTLLPVLERVAPEAFKLGLAGDDPHPS